MTNGDTCSSDFGCTSDAGPCGGQHGWSGPATACQGQTGYEEGCLTDQGWYCCWADNCNTPPPDTTKRCCDCDGYWDERCAMWGKRETSDSETSSELRRQCLTLFQTFGGVAYDSEAHGTIPKSES